MRKDEVKTVILVDDTASGYRDGGDRAVTREDRYKVLFWKLKKGLDQANSLYMILGDGIFKVEVGADVSSTQVLFEEAFSFPDGAHGETLTRKILDLAGDDNALLLIDYMLNKSTRKERDGKALALYVLSEVDRATIQKILYTRDDLSKAEKEELVSQGHTVITPFPISAPTDAAAYILEKLE